MTEPAPLRVFARAATWWDAGMGPPRADLLSRAQRLGADFSVRILAHVLGELASQSPIPLGHLPWVWGVCNGAAEQLDDEVCRVLAPQHAVVSICAGASTVPMALVEAMSHLVDHSQVLVMFGHDAIAPHYEALAAGLILGVAPRDEQNLVLSPPIFRSLVPQALTCSTKSPPLDPLVEIIRAINAIKIASKSILSEPSERRGHWRIELSHPF